MKTSTLETSDQDDPKSPPARRVFLRDMLTGGAVLAGLSTASLHPSHASTREISLQEADFYAPHTLAG